jgi:cytochrome c-type biogenesis protein CcmH/NrfF
MQDIISVYPTESIFSGLTTYYAIIIAAAVAYQLAAAAFTAWLAVKKGYDVLVWFFLGLFFGVISLFAVGFAPVKNMIKHQTEKPASGQSGGEVKRDYNMAKTWKCPKCSNENPNDSYTCKSCGYKIL